MCEAQGKLFSDWDDARHELWVEIDQCVVRVDQGRRLPGLRPLDLNVDDGKVAPR